MDLKNVRIFAILFREHSSVGLEHLPYKQRVGGSTPSAPTKASQLDCGAFFVSNLTFLGLSASRVMMSKVVGESIDK